MRVLVIEDDGDACEVLRLRLGQLGCEVFLATNAPDGLAIAQAEALAFALLDLHIDGALSNGLSLLEQLAGLGVPVVVHSVYVRHLDDLPAVRAHARQVLPKPFRMPALRQLVAAYAR